MGAESRHEVAAEVKDTGMGKAQNTQETGAKGSPPFLPVRGRKGAAGSHHQSGYGPLSTELKLCLGLMNARGKGSHPHGLLHSEDGQGLHRRMGLV